MEVVMQRNNVVFLRPRDPRWMALRGVVQRLQDGLEDACCRIGSLLRWVLWLGLVMVRAVAAALLVLFEPVLRLLLLPLAFGCFLMSLLFGLLLHAPGFPTWGMLALSVGLLWLYWLYVAVMVWCLGGRRG
jgi:hypothetical protein